jgi:hypothetical protein
MRFQVLTNLKDKITRTQKACLAITLTDIVVVEAYYRPLQDWGNIWQYHAFVFLPLGLVLFAFCAKRNIWEGLAFAGFMFFGLEDTLFYLLNPSFGLRGQMPPKYWGVTILGVNEPSLLQIAVINVIGLALILALLKARNLEFKRVSVRSFPFQTRRRKNPKL